MLVPYIGHKGMFGCGIYTDCGDVASVVCKSAQGIAMESFAQSLNTVLIVVNLA